MGSCCCVHASKAPTSITEHSGLASYGAIIQKIRPGDIILFRNSHAQAAAQRLFCGTDWDHVGLVVQDYHCGEDGVPCCGQDTKAWQAERREKKPSDPWGRPWHTLEAMSNGVDVYPFSSEQVKHFRGVQSVRRLHIPPERRPAAEARLTEFVDQVKGMPYSKTVLTLVRAANYFGTNDLEGDLQCFFCSELVAAAYKAMGVLFWAKSDGLIVASSSLLGQSTCEFQKASTCSSTLAIPSRSTRAPSVSVARERCFSDDCSSFVDSCSSAEPFGDK